MPLASDTASLQSRGPRSPIGGMSAKARNAKAPSTTGVAAQRATRRRGPAQRQTIRSRPSPPAATRKTAATIRPGTSIGIDSMARARTTSASQAAQSANLRPPRSTTPSAVIGSAGQRGAPAPAAPAARPPAPPASSPPALRPPGPEASTRSAAAARRRLSAAAISSAAGGAPANKTSPKVNAPALVRVGDRGRQPLSGMRPPVGTPARAPHKAQRKRRLVPAGAAGAPSGGRVHPPSRVSAIRRAAAWRARRTGG